MESFSNEEYGVFLQVVESETSIIGIARLRQSGDLLGPSHAESAWAVY